MKRINWKLTAKVFAAVAITNGVLAVLSPAYGDYSIISIPASILNVPGLLGFAAFARLDRALTLWGEADSFDYTAAIAVALVSAAAWSACAGLCFRMKQCARPSVTGVPFLTAK